MPSCSIVRRRPAAASRPGSTSREITKTEPEPSLTAPLRKSGGRNNLGRITLRHRGGGHKRLYRIIDFKRDKVGVPARVAAIEYDPNRSARIALLQYADGEKRYILAPVGLVVGDRVEAGPKADIKLGNALPLAQIPLGTMIHTWSFPEAGRAARAERRATSQLMAKEGDYALLKLPSVSSTRRLACRATIVPSRNLEHENIPTARRADGAGSGSLRRTGHRDDTCRPSPRRRRGAFQGNIRRARGQADQRIQTRHNKRTDRWIVQRRKVR